MSYLARLKQLEKEKNSQHAPHVELTELPKAPFVSFGGTVPGANENIFSDDDDQMHVGDDHDEPEFDEEALHLAWVFRFVGGEPETGVFTAPVNYRQALAMYPQAIAAVPLNIAEGMSCQTCLHRLRPGGYPSPFLCCGRDDLPPAYGEGHPLRQLPEDGGSDCGQWKARNHD